jgi:hypothetical protein
VARNPDESLFVVDACNGVRVRHDLIGRIGFVENDGRQRVMKKDALFASSPRRNKSDHARSACK